MLHGRQFFASKSYENLQQNQQSRSTQLSGQARWNLDYKSSHAQQRCQDILKNQAMRKIPYWLKIKIHMVAKSWTKYGGIVFHDSYLMRLFTYPIHLSRFYCTLQNKLSISVRTHRISIIN